MIISAHYLCVTRLCRAEGCENDAENYSRLCYRCARRDDVRIHVIPVPLEAILWCSICRQDKPDEQFAMRPTTGEASGGRTSNRRGRYYACLKCEALARRQERAKRAKRKPS